MSKKINIAGAVCDQSVWVEKTLQVHPTISKKLNEIKSAIDLT